MEQIFVDTSAWFVFANRGDPMHSRVAAVLRRFEDAWSHHRSFSTKR
jgi:predicted nucleic acid-binding protein